MTALAPYADADSDTLYEVVDGVTVEKTMSVMAHVIATKISSRLEPYATDHKLGWVIVEGMFDLPKSTHIRRPDVAFVTFDQWPPSRRPPRDLAWPFAPTLAIEVISPSDTYASVNAKVAEYLRAGVRLVWVIDPDQEQVLAHALAGSRRFDRNDTLDAEPVIPGFRLALTALFPEYDPEPTDAERP